MKSAVWLLVWLISTSLTAAQLQCTITLVAGTGSTQTQSTTSPALRAAISLRGSFFVNSSTILFVDSDADKVRKIEDGNVSTFANFIGTTYKPTASIFFHKTSKTTFLGARNKDKNLERLLLVSSSGIMESNQKGPINSIWETDNKIYVSGAENFGYYSGPTFSQFQNILTGSISGITSDASSTLWVLYTSPDTQQPKIAWMKGNLPNFLQGFFESQSPPLTSIGGIACIGNIMFVSDMGNNLIRYWNTTTREPLQSLANLTSPGIITVENETSLLIAHGNIPIERTFISRITLWTFNALETNNSSNSSNSSGSIGSSSSNSEAVAVPFDLSSEEARPIIIGAAAGAGVLILLILVIIVVIVVRRRRRKSPSYILEDDEDRGKILKGVQKGGLLGSGNFGQVFKGNWEGVQVALKQVKHQESRDRLAEEAKLLRKLDHVNIVKLFGLTEIEGGTFIVLEFLPLGSLETVMKEGSFKFTDSDIRGIATDVARGLKYLHGEKIIHRDLALRNLLVSAQVQNDKAMTYSVKISDFGLSKALSAENEYYHIDGNQFPVRWSAPEVIHFQRYSFQSDIWGYGIVFWELYSEGALPYAGMSNFEVTQFIAAGNRLLLPKLCPESLRVIMTECWKEDAKQRPSLLWILEVLLGTKPKTLRTLRAPPKPPQDLPMIPPNSTNSSRSPSTLRQPPIGMKPSSQLTSISKQKNLEEPLYQNK